MEEDPTTLPATAPPGQDYIFAAWHPKQSTYIGAYSFPEWRDSEEPCVTLIWGSLQTKTSKQTGVRFPSKVTSLNNDTPITADYALKQFHKSLKSNNRRSGKYEELLTSKGENHLINLLRKFDTGFKK
tara:strand:- start:4768 stop:5151 length:384 start_codon:yes stop_codon:yes gene_type:complete